MVLGDDEAQRLTHDLVMPKPTLQSPSGRAGRSGASLPKKPGIKPGSAVVSSNLRKIP